MTTSTRRTRRFGACLAALTLVVAACGDDDAETDTADTEAPDGTDAPPDTAADALPGGTTPADAGTQPAGGMPTELGEGEGEVNLIAWAGYVEDGSNDPAIDWVTRSRRPRVPSNVQSATRPTRGAICER